MLATYQIDKHILVSTLDEFKTELTAQMTEVRFDLLAVQLLPFAANRSEPDGPKFSEAICALDSSTNDKSGRRCVQAMQPTYLGHANTPGVSSQSMVPYLNAITNHLTIMSCRDVGWTEG